MIKPPPVAPASEGQLRFGAQPQHVLVTGGTGFIGRILIAALLADGHAVTVWTRDAAAARRRLGSSVRCVQRPGEIAPGEPCDVVINLAGARILGPRWTMRRRQALLDSRVGTTDALVAWIAGRARKPWLLLSGSAIGYYGIQAQGDATGLTEASPPQDIFMSQLCQCWEAAAQAATPLGVHVACMRFGFVLGRQGSLPLLQLPIALGLGGRLGSGRQWLSWIHVHDLVRAMAHVWNIAAQVKCAAEAQVFNFTAPGALSQSDFTRAAAGVMHRPFWLPTPAAPVRWLLGEQADLLLDGQRVVPARLLQTGFAFAFPDAVAALTDLREAR